MPYYFMRDTPLQALEQLMMSQPGQKPRECAICYNAEEKIGFSLPVEWQTP